MDNNGSSNNYSIESKSHLYQEMTALKVRIEKFLNGVASEMKVDNTPPTKNVGVKAAILKTHQFTLRESIEWMGKMDDTEWIEHKADLQRDFKAASDALDVAIKEY